MKHIVVRTILKANHLNNSGPFLQKLTEQGINFSIDPEQNKVAEKPYNLREPLGQALAVVDAKNREEIQTIIKLCNKHNIGIIPQGGNTGLVWGSTPTGNNTEIILRLAAQKVQVTGNKFTTGGGTPIKDIQDAALERGLVFPVHYEPVYRATIAAAVSNDSGGVNAVKDGTTIDNVTEVSYVKADGEISTEQPGKVGHYATKKNSVLSAQNNIATNQGLFGYVVEVSGKLKEKPKETCFFVITLSAGQLNQVTHIVSMLQSEAQKNNFAYEMLEFVNHNILKAVKQFNDQVQIPFLAELEDGGYQLIVKATAAEHVDLNQRISAVLGGLSAELQQKISIAKSAPENTNILQYREACSNSSRKAAVEFGMKTVPNDPCIPLDRTIEHYQICKEIIEKIYGGIDLIWGHLGDGNIHINPLIPSDNLTPLIDQTKIATLSAEAQNIFCKFLANNIESDRVPTFDKFVDFSAYEFGGVHSAEHGGLGPKTIASTMQYYHYPDLCTLITKKIEQDPGLTFRKEFTGQMFELFIERSKTELNGQSFENKILAEQIMLILKTFLLDNNGMSRITNPDAKTSIMARIEEYENNPKLISKKGQNLGSDLIR